MYCLNRVFSFFRIFHILRTASVGLTVKILCFFYLVLIMGAASICVWFFSMPRLLFGHLSRRWMVIGPAGSWSLMWEIMYQNGFIDGWPTDGWDISLGGRVGTAQWSIWWKMFSIIYGSMACANTITVICLVTSSVKDSITEMEVAHTVGNVCLFFNAPRLFIRSLITKFTKNRYYLCGLK